MGAEVKGDREQVGFFYNDRTGKYLFAELDPYGAVTVDPEGTLNHVFIQDLGIAGAQIERETKKITPVQPDETWIFLVGSNHDFEIMGTTEAKIQLNGDMAEPMNGKRLYPFVR